MVKKTKSEKPFNYLERKYRGVVGYAFVLFGGLLLLIINLF